MNDFNEYRIPIILIGFAYLYMRSVHNFNIRGYRPFKLALVLYIGGVFISGLSLVEMLVFRNNIDFF